MFEKKITPSVVSNRWVIKKMMNESDAMISSLKVIALMRDRLLLTEILFIMVFFAFSFFQQAFFEKKINKRGGEFLLN